MTRLYNFNSSWAGTTFKPNGANGTFRKMWEYGLSVMKDMPIDIYMEEENLN